MYNTPMKSKGPVANNVYAIGLYAKDDLLLVFDTVNTVVEDSYEHRGRCHEPHWVSAVVTPIMNRLQKLRSFKSTARPVRALNM